MQEYLNHVNELRSIIASQQYTHAHNDALPGRVSQSPSAKRERSEDTVSEPRKKTRRVKEGSRGATPLQATPGSYSTTTLAPPVATSPCHSDVNCYAPAQAPYSQPYGGPPNIAPPCASTQVYQNQRYGLQPNDIQYAPMQVYQNQAYSPHPNAALYAPAQVYHNPAHGYQPYSAAPPTMPPALSSTQSHPAFPPFGGLPTSSAETGPSYHILKTDQPLLAAGNNHSDPSELHHSVSISTGVLADKAPKRWRAEPGKLSPSKKAKYYGVRAGRTPGIYYNWTDVDNQVKGFPNAAHQSFKTQKEVEDYMNHEPENCTFSSCAARCKAARAARPQTVARETYTPGYVSEPSASDASPTTITRSSHALYPQVEPQQPPSKMPLTPISPNSSQPTGMITAKPICNCGNSDSKHGSKQITCANADCKVMAYHAACVGLAKRVPDPTWKCRDCRAPPPVLPISQVAPGPVEPDLSPQQAAVVDLILRGSENVCYTGSAGTGKSTVLKAVVRELENQGKTVDIVAPSGIAALAVGGQTVFSYAGWVPDTFKLNLDGIAQRAHNKKIYRRLRSTDVLIIEEISMVDSHVFMRLEASCREARRAPRSQYEKERGSCIDGKLPFGGIQVIVTGDFCQLPPVKPFKFCLYCGGDELPGWHGNRGGVLLCPRCKRKYADDDKWAFRNEAWKLCDFKCVELTEIHRQKDPIFTAILQKCRRSLPLTPQDKQLLLHHPANTTDAVHLRPTIAEVLRINGAAFSVLPGIVSAYECHDEFAWERDLHPDLENRGVRKDDGRYQGREDGPLKALQDHRFEERLELKINTLVILLVNLNIEAGLVNGAQGKVVGFQPYSQSGGAQPQDQPSSYLPEILGEYKEVRQQRLGSFVRTRSVKAWPIVKFNNGITQIIYAQCQLSELGLEKPYSLLSRTQVPLIPAWAITVHKSQGMTLTRVEVDLSRAFEREMIYVALSRCKTLDGLKVHNLPRNMDYGPNVVVQEFLEKFKPASALVREPRKTSQPSSGGCVATESIVLE